MPRGQPDYGMYAPQTVTSNLSDMAELAVRLGSIDIFDRRGKVIDLDDFESPLRKWVASLVGNATANLSGVSAKSGAQSLLLHIEGAADNIAEIIRGVMPVPSNRLGVEISYALPSATAYLEIRLFFDNGVSARQGLLRLNFTTLKLSYWDGVTFAWEELDDLDAQSLSPYVYYPIKLVIDTELSRYARLVFGTNEYDLSAISLGTVGLGVPRVNTIIRWVRIAGVDSNIYLDDYILTMDEP